MNAQAMEMINNLKTNTAAARVDENCNVKEVPGVLPSDVLKMARKETKAKSKVPIYAAEGELKKIIDDYWMVKKSLEDLEGRDLVLHGKLMDGIEPVKKGYWEKGELVTSIRAMGEKGGLTVTWTNRFTATDIENEEMLKRAFGEKYGQYFKQTNEIKVKDGGEETVNRLLELLGVDTFLELFEVKQIVKATELYGKDVNVTEEMRNEAEAAGIRQVRASVRAI